MAMKTQQYPEFDLSWGWQVRNTFISDTLTNAVLNGTSTLRIPGLQEVSVVFSVTALAGGASLTFIVEGSNDGSTNWHIIAQTPASSPTTATGEVLIGSNGVVNLGRWERIRVRITNSAAGTFTVTAFVSGMPKPASSSVGIRTVADTVAGGGTARSGALVRLGGSRFGTVQVVLSAAGLNLGGNTMGCTLQGSPDGGTTWVDISDQSAFAAAGSAQMTQDGSTVIDLGGFNNFRFTTVDIGGATVNYVYNAFIGMDSTEWLVHDNQGSVIGDFQEQNTILDLVSIGVEAADARLITWQLLRSDGTPLLEARTLAFVVYDTSLAGDFDASTNGTLTNTGLIGTAIAGLTTNTALITTNTSGTVAFSILDAAVETVFCTGGTGRIFPKTVPFIVAQADEATVTFAA